MNVNFDKNTLMQSSIFELRNIARELGVYSPTLYKKQDLIDKMMQIVNGEVSPYIPKNKKGRPPKNISSSKIIDAILPTQDSLNNSYSLSIGDKTLVLGEHTKAFLEDNKNKPKTICNKSGYFTLTKEGYGLLRDKKHLNDISYCVYISASQVKSLNLKVGDFVEAVCKTITADKPSIFVEPININGVATKYFNPKNFDSLEVEFSTKDFVFNTQALDDNLKEIFPSLLGQSVLALNNKLNRVDLYKLLSECNNNTNYTFITLSLEVNKEKEMFLNNLTNMENFCTLIDDSSPQQFSIINLCLQRAKRLVENNKDVVLIVDSLDKIVKIQNSQDGRALLDLTSESLKMAKCYVAAARKTANEGSLTVIAIVNYKQNNTFDQTLIDEFEEYVSKIATLS